MPIRLDSFLSKNGISSRRKAKELISQEKVTVNGEVVLEVLQVDPEKDEISVENQLVNPKYLKKTPEKCKIKIKTIILAAFLF
mgnify:CR=1 FL=1